MDFIEILMLKTLNRNRKVKEIYHELNCELRRMIPESILYLWDTEKIVSYAHIAYSNSYTALAIALTQDKYADATLFELYHNKILRLTSIMKDNDVDDVYHDFSSDHGKPVSISEIREHFENDHDEIEMLGIILDYEDHKFNPCASQKNKIHVMSMDNRDHFTNFKIENILR